MCLIGGTRAKNRLNLLREHSAGRAEPETNWYRYLFCTYSSTTEHDFPQAQTAVHDAANKTAVLMYRSERRWVTLVNMHEQP